MRPSRSNASTYVPVNALGDDRARHGTDNQASGDDIPVCQVTRPHRQSMHVLEAASLVEILMAVSLMAITALGVFQILAFTETQLIQSRNDLGVRKGEAQALSYVYDDFLESQLADNLTAELYDNDSVSEQDLRIATVLGTQSRYQAGLSAAKCTTTVLTNETVGTVSFASDCVLTPEGGGTTQTVAQNINDVIAAGATVVFAVENAGGRCTASTAIDNALVAPGNTAVLTVDDPECLNSPLPSDVPAGSEIIFPRFVVYSALDPAQYHASLIESAAANVPGFSLTGPPSIELRSAVNTNVDDFILTANTDNESGTVTFGSNLAGTRLSIVNPGGAGVTGDNTSSVTISGTLRQLRRAIRNLFYLSADGYFGDDNLTVTARSGPITRELVVPVNVLPNCGNQTLGTATRFDLSTIDGMGNFDEDNATFFTSVSIWDNSSPQHFYGYCDSWRDYRYDYATQDNISNPNCTTVDNVTYQRASSRLMTYDNGTAWNVGRAINIMLYEESDAMGDDRFAIIVVLDAVPGTCSSGAASTSVADSRVNGRAMTNQDFHDLGLPDSIWPNSKIPEDSNRRCRVTFQLSNIEPGRNLDDATDNHTFTDDPGEYTGVIGNDMQLLAHASWNVPIDGLVIPLRIDNSSLSPVRLQDYTFGDPIFELVWWDTLNAWNIRSLNTATNMIEFTRTPFTDPPAGRNQAVRLNISQSRSCN